jgi:hypothetical protein
MMVGADMCCAVMVGLVPLAAWSGMLSSPLVLAVAFGVSTAFCWFDSAAWGSVTRVVGKARLAEANNLIWSTTVVLGIAVPAGAGLLAAVTDPAVVLLIDAATYLVSAALIGRIGDLNAVGAMVSCAGGC